MEARCASRASTSGGGAGEMCREFRFLPREGETPRGFCHSGLIDYSARY